MPSWRYLKHIQQAQTFRGDINGIKDRKQNQRMHFTSRHYLLLSAGKADGDSQNQSGSSETEYRIGFVSLHLLCQLIRVSNV